MGRQRAQENEAEMRKNPVFDEQGEKGDATGKEAVRGGGGA